jgi:hypothetical protein
MFVTRGCKNSLFDSLSNLDCGQRYKFWIYQSHPMSAPATQNVDSWSRVYFSHGHFCVYLFFCWMVEHFLLCIATRRRDSQGGKPHFDISKDLILLSCRRAMEHLCVLQLETALATLVTTRFTLADRRWRSRYGSSDQCIMNAFRSPEFEVWVFRNGHSDCDDDCRTVVAVTST